MNPTLDFLLAWRDLLPFSRSASVVSVGWQPEEREVLQRARDELSQTEDFSLCVVNADHCDAANLRGLLSGQCVDSETIFAVVGSAPRAWSTLKQVLGPRKFNVREYALLPEKAPRLAVPLASTRVARAGLALHRPGRFLQRAATVAGTALLALGWMRPIRRKILLVAGLGECQLIPDIGTRSSEHVALYMGGAVPGRLSVALPIANDGTTDRLIKFGSTPAAIQRLRAEASTLQALSNGVLSSQTPKLLAQEQAGARVSVHQSYRRRRFVRAGKLDREAQKFLVKLGSQRSTYAPLQVYLEQNEAPLSAPEDARLILAISKRASEWNVRLCSVHGDFAPWNCSWTDQGFFVYDWERSGVGLSLADAFYFRVSVDMHVADNPCPSRAVSKACDFASPIARLIGISPAEVKTYLALWLVMGGLTGPLPSAMKSVIANELYA